MAPLFCYFEGVSFPEGVGRIPPLFVANRANKLKGGSMPSGYQYSWHGKPCRVLVKPVFKNGIKRNALIELATGERLTVPWRAIRKRKE